MLTQLIVNGESLNAVQLLALLQQAYPSQTKPEGEGTFKKPWVLKTPEGWFWAAKKVAVHTRIHKFEVPTSKELEDVDGSTEYWFNVAGRYISVAAATLYSRDRGEIPQVPPKGAPGAQKLEISYPGLYEKLLDENGGALNDKASATALRAVLAGTKPAGDQVALRMLAAVMFMSEVARNTTAFHTGLMLLDLIEHGIKIDTSNFQYDFKNALWSPGVLDTIMANKRENKKDPRPAVSSEKDTFASQGGERALASAMGVAPMSHTLSESGGAFDLVGKGSFVPADKAQPKVAAVQSPLTGVRRKEATLLIRWLSLALKKSNPELNVAVGDGEQQYDFNNSYTFIEQHFKTRENDLGEPVGNPGDLGNMKYILPLLNKRSETFACMIQA